MQFPAHDLGLDHFTSQPFTFDPQSNVFSHLAMRHYS